MVSKEPEIVSEKHVIRIRIEVSCFGVDVFWHICYEVTQHFVLALGTGNRQVSIYS